MNIGCLMTYLYVLLISADLFQKQEMQCTYNVSLRRVHETIVDMEEQ